MYTDEEVVRRKQIQEKMESLKTELESLSSEYTLLSKCNASREFISFMQKSPVKIKTYRDADFDIVCTHCGKEIEESLTHFIKVNQR